MIYDYLEVEIDLDRKSSVSLVRDPEGGPGHSPDVVIKCWMKSKHRLLQKVLYFAVIWVLHPDLPVMGVIVHYLFFENGLVAELQDDLQGGFGARIRLFVTHCGEVSREGVAGKTNRSLNHSCSQFKERMISELTCFVLYRWRGCQYQ